MIAEQVLLLKCFSPEFHERHIEAPYTGVLSPWFGNALKDIGKLYLQTTIDCASRRQ